VRSVRARRKSVAPADGVGSSAPVSSNPTAETSAGGRRVAAATARSPRSRSTVARSS
jgi:hypothetical protein